MICPPDVLCKWLGGRWETMEELAMALERETLNSIGGRPCPPRKIGRPRLVELPTPLTRRVQSDIEKRKAAQKRKEKNWTKATFKIERMMSLACPKRRRYAA